MTWKELSDSVEDYYQDLYGDKVPFTISYFKMRLIWMLSRLSFDDIRPGSGVDLLDYKVQKYGFDGFEVWYEEHVKDTKEEILTGVLMDLFAMPRLFHQSFSDKVLDSFMMSVKSINSAVSDYFLPAQTSFDIYKYACTLLLSKKSNDVVWESVSFSVCYLIRKAGITDIERLMQRRLEYSYIKNMRKLKYD